MLLGIQALVDEMMRRPGASTYYCNGFTFIDAYAFALTSLIASSSFVADSVLALLLEDDRVPKIYNELQQ